MPNPFEGEGHTPQVPPQDFEAVLELARIRFRQGYGDHFPTHDDPDYALWLADQQQPEHVQGH